MSLHIAPTTGCNLGCTYCYENPDREMREEWVSKEYDMDAIMDRLEDWKDRYPHETPGFHGGEPLLMKYDDMEELCQWIYENYGEGGHIQTNATMLSERHIELFAEYDWSVGVSCDGPGELNEHRIAYEGGDDVTRKHTKTTLENIKRLREADVSVGLIVVLHESNAGTDEKLDKLLEWMTEMGDIGVTGHYNPAIPYEDVQTDISLSPDRLKEVFIATWEWMQEEPDRVWNPMRDYVDNLLGLGLTDCVNNKCDVYNAGAAKIIMGNGETTGCGKTWSGVGDGGKFLQGESTDNEFGETEERYEMLKKTPGPHGDGADMGGCKGCDYWNVCTGGCPSSGINGDHRNRTIWCEAKYGLYERIENDLRTLMPNVSLITDYPWDLDLNSAASMGRLNMQPFAAMDTNEQGRKSTYGHFEHPASHPYDRLPQEVINNIDFEDWANIHRETGVSEENITVDEEKGTAHIDSSPPSQATDDDYSSDESDSLWEKVN